MTRSRRPRDSRCLHPPAVRRIPPRALCPGRGGRCSVKWVKPEGTPRGEALREVLLELLELRAGSELQELPGTGLTKTEAAGLGHAPQVNPN
jgi:hypothetical protein